MNTQQYIDNAVESLLYVPGFSAIAEIIRSGKYELKLQYTNEAISRLERTINWPNSYIVIESERKALNDCKILLGVL